MLSYGDYIEKNIEALRQEVNKIEDEIEEIKSFSAYLLACRKMEAKLEGKNIYPELRENDGKYIIEKYKDLYEAKRKEYEKQHKARVELNKDRKYWTEY